MSYTKVAIPLSLGSELLTNGSFAGNANGWSLDTGWTYSSNSALHSSGTGTLTQANVGIVASQYYQLLITVSGTVGSVNVGLTLLGTSVTINAGAGAVILTLQASISNNHTFYCTPTTNFNGAISAVSLKQNNQVYVKQFLT